MFNILRLIFNNEGNYATFQIFYVCIFKIVQFQTFYHQVRMSGDSKDLGLKYRTSQFNNPLK